MHNNSPRAIVAWLQRLFNACINSNHVFFNANVPLVRLYVYMRVHGFALRASSCGELCAFFAVNLFVWFATPIRVCMCVCIIALERRGCEQNQASYNVFQLDAFVNTTQIADLKQFPKVTTAIDAITVSERTMLSLTQTIQNILENMLHTSSFNLTTYRVSIGAPTPEKDLATFIDQMQRVALQVSDVWGPLGEPKCY